MTDYSIGDITIANTNQFIVFNKPVGLGVQEDKTGEKSLKNLAEIYAKTRIFTVHRLDRPASGLVVMAKTAKTQAHLSEQWQKQQVIKKYLAVVKHLPDPEEGTITNFLKKVQRLNKSFLVDANDPDGKEAQLKYSVLAKSDTYHLLEIDLLTGRHHQIRAQLASINNPIKGDVKYGFKRGNKDRSIHLHAWKLSFLHPVSAERLTFVAPPPSDKLWQVLTRDLTE